MCFNDLDGFFSSIKDEEYIVLRNYEEYDNDRFLDNHPDIDILCSNVKAILKRTKMQPRGRKDDGLHYMTIINQKKVPIDLRHIGDGYYDEKMERDVLRNRIKQNSYYIMNDEDYFYTLLYHAVVHKGFVSADYLERLRKLGDKIGVNYNILDSGGLLDDYMRGKRYFYTYPKAWSTVAHFDNVDKSLVRFSFLHFLRTIRSKVGKISKSILGKR